MKGRKLSLEEVLNLEDGTKVWVELVGKEWNITEDCIATLKTTDCGYYDLFDEDDVNFGCFLYEGKLKPIGIIEGYELNIYEYIDNDCYNKSIISSMAQEICNLRGLDLTDKNINEIIDEFKEEK